VSVLIARTDAGPVHESELESAFILNFIKYIEWPLKKFPKELFRISIYKSPSIQNHLEHLSSKQTVRGTPISIMRYDEVESIPEDSQIVYIDSENPQVILKIVKKFSNHPVLLISKGAGYSKLGIMINFYIQDKHVKFEINNTAAEEVKLKISSTLLNISKVIEE
jgi:hypothetical protein